MIISLSAGAGSTEIYPWVVSGTVNVGDVVAITGNKTISRAAAGTANTYPPMGICTARSGDLAQIALNGEIATGLSGLTTGTTYWLSTTAGQLVTTKPASNAFVVGTATSTTDLLVSSSQTNISGSSNGGTLTSFGITSSNNSVIVTGSPITESGTINLALAAPNLSTGGTGLSSTAGQGAMIYATSATTTVSQAISPSFKNRFINGDMRIDQRNNGAAVVKGNYPVDRWAYNTSGAATLSASRSTTAPPGFSNSMTISVTTGVTCAAAESAGFYQQVEGTQIADFAWGTASAKPVTISFWVRSSVTGTYGVRLISYATVWANFQTYTINQANTWERKTLTFAAATGGTWYIDNQGSLSVWFDIGSGTNYRGVNENTWTSSGWTTSSSQANFVGTTGASLFVTGVQLEQSEVATAFELRPYTVEMMLCRRYYNYYGGTGTFYGTWTQSASSPPNRTGQFGIRYSTTMRSAPSVTYSAASTFSLGQYTGTSAVSFYPLSYGNQGFIWFINQQSGFIYVGYVTNRTGYTSFVAMNAEI